MNVKTTKMFLKNVKIMNHKAEKKMTMTFVLNIAS